MPSRNGTVAHGWLGGDGMHRTAFFLFHTPPHETAAWNLVFCENANMSMVIDILNNQLGFANSEYHKLKVKLEKVQEKLDGIFERYTVVLRGPQFEAFEGEKAGLDVQKARLEGQEKVLEEGMHQWLGIIHKCTSGIFSIATTQDCTSSSS